jgi:hypothetical protein
MWSIRLPFFSIQLEVQPAFSHWFLVGEILHSFCRMSPIMITGKNKVGRKSRGKRTVTLLSFGLGLCFSPKSWGTCNE